MARDLKEAAEILKEHGLDLTKLLQDTHVETMLTLGSLLGECLEVVLKTHMLKIGKKINERTFQKGGKLETLASKIRRAKDWGLLDEMTHSDADLLREIRNEFGHLKKRLHFDSQEIVEWVKKLSTYESAETNQAAIFAAVSKVTGYLKAKVQAG
jgi:DNA-binding MltR family transcriptional regulator